jgi:hypothetical protein
MLNVSRMSDVGAATTLGEVCDGIKRFVESNPNTAKDILENLIDGVLDPLNEDDFWGTEGWQHAFGLD